MKRRALIGIGITLAAAGGIGMAQGPGGLPPREPEGDFRATMPGIIVGTIRQIDRARGAVEVQPAGGGNARWVVFTPATIIFRQAAATLAEIRPNDTIVVQGVPTAVQATQIQLGQQPGVNIRGDIGAPGLAGGAMVQQVPLPVDPGLVAGNAPQPRPLPLPIVEPSIRVTGTVLTVRPLVIAMAGNRRLSVAADASTRLTKILSLTLADLKVGDTIQAVGRIDEQGNLIAGRVEVGASVASPLR